MNGISYIYIPLKVLVQTAPRLDQTSAGSQFFSARGSPFLRGLELLFICDFTAAVIWLTTGIWHSHISFIWILDFLILQSDCIGSPWTLYNLGSSYSLVWFNICNLQFLLATAVFGPLAQFCLLTSTLDFHWTWSRLHWLALVFLLFNNFHSQRTIQCH